jgi:hypothetical protein
MKTKRPLTATDVARAPWLASFRRTPRRGPIPLLEIDEAFAPATADALLAQLAARSDAERAALSQWIDEVPPSIAGSYLQAVAYGAAGRDAEAAISWSDFFDRFPSQDPFLMAPRARALSRVGQWDAAAEVMRAALATRPSYTFYARMQRLIDEIAGRAGGAVRQARIAVLGSSTTSLLVPVLRALCFRDRIEAAFHEGAFGAFRQEILERDGVLAAFKPTVVIIAPHWRDLDLPALAAGEPQAAVSAVVEEYRGLWAALHRASDCHVIQHTFDLPAEDSAALLSVQLAGGRRRLIRRINLALADALTPGVSLLDTEQVAAEVGTDRWANPRLWYLARQHPSSDALPELAEEQMAHVRAVLGLSRKVLVCDLDNTLWKGVIGEDGLTGIKVGPGSPDGEAYADLQRYLRDLKDRGVVLAGLLEEQSRGRAGAVSREARDGARARRLRRVQGELGRQGGKRPADRRANRRRSRQPGGAGRQPVRARVDPEPAPPGRRPGARRLRILVCPRSRSGPLLPGNRLVTRGPAARRRLPARAGAGDRARERGEPGRLSRRPAHARHV